MFNDVNTQPRLDQMSLAFRAAAASGLSHTSLLRHLVSITAAAADLPPLPELPPAAFRHTIFTPRQTMQVKMTPSYNVTDRPRQRICSLSGLCAIPSSI